MSKNDDAMPDARNVRAVSGLSAGVLAASQAGLDLPAMPNRQRAIFPDLHECLVQSKEGDCMTTDNTMRATALYPEGFDASCGFSVSDMCEANATMCDMTGERKWDVPRVAAALAAARAEGYKAGMERAADICVRMASVSAVSYETGAACAEAIRAEFGKEGK